MHGPGGRAVTTNLDALLLENEALRHQVRLLREELALLQSSRSAEAQAQAQTQAAADFSGRPHPRQGARAWRDDQEAPRPQPAPEPGWRQAAPRGERVRSWRSGPEVTTGAAPGITPQLVRQWAEALSSHPRWRELRLGSRLEGDPAAGGSLELGLQALLDDLRSRSHNPALELEDALDRRAPGLGAELRWALAGPASRVKAAVRAAFALHGPRAADRLSADPQAVVEELLAAIARLEVQVRQEAQTRRQQTQRQQAWWRQQDGRRPGGRSWGAGGEGGGAGAAAGDPRAGGTGADGSKDHSRAGAQGGGSGGSRDAGSSRAGSAGSGDSRGSSGTGAAHGSGEGRRSEHSRQAAPDRQRVEALDILELSWGAPLAAVKAAHRRLVKRHHPDMGGDAESFRRINDAYQLLIA
jgi:hypothetical protein